jgi:uncharacterized membrane protein
MDRNPVIARFRKLIAMPIRIGLGVCILILCGLPVMGGVFVSKALAASGWTVVNRTPETVYVAIAYDRGDGTYVSQGWWKLNPCGGAKIVHGGRFPVSGAFLYAENADRSMVWTGDTLFCVTDDKFMISRGGNCERRGYRTAAFRLHNITSDSFTTTLNGRASSGSVCFD